MIKVSHFIWTYALSLFIFYYVFNENLLATFLLSFLTAAISWLPDIDIRVFKRISEFNKKTYYIFYIFTLPFLLFFKHRTWTHAIYLPLFFLYLGEFIYVGDLQLIFRILYLAFFLHILEDSFTVSGVKLFYPIKFSFKLAKFNTNSNLHFHILNFMGIFIGVAFLFFVKYFH